MPHKLSLAFLTLVDCEPVKAIRVADAAGFDMVGLRLLPAEPTEADYPLLNDPTRFFHIGEGISDALVDGFVSASIHCRNQLPAGETVRVLCDKITDCIFSPDLSEHISVCLLYTSPSPRDS